MLRLVARKSVAAALRKLAPEDHVAALAALRQVPEVFGHPHRHAGLGLRKLRPGLYECRAGLLLRAVFVRSGDTLEVQLVGTHDDVRRYLRQRAR